MDFDLDLAVREDSENPVYYVQYAHARICTLLSRLAEEGHTVPKAAEIQSEVLSSDEEKALIRALARLPEEIHAAARDYDPSRINRYLVELAGQFHRFYGACRIKGEEPAVLAARLKLADSVRSVLANWPGPAGRHRTGKNVTAKDQAPLEPGGFFHALGIRARGKQACAPKNKPLPNWEGAWPAENRDRFPQALCHPHPACQGERVRGGKGERTEPQRTGAAAIE